MAYVITDACVDIKDRACVFCCPVDCIYEGLRTLYIQPEECINCGLCLSVCPVDAIYDEADVPSSAAFPGIFHPLRLTAEIRRIRQCKQIICESRLVMGRLFFPV